MKFIYNMYRYVKYMLDDFLYISKIILNPIMVKNSKNKTNKTN